MVSAAWEEISSRLARSCLVAISFATMIDAVLTIFAAAAYPYLIDYTHDDLYINSSRSITVIYSGISIIALLVAVSTAIAINRSSTNYVLFHICITGVFLPVSILVYFTTASSRYKASDYEADYYHMISNYKINYDPHAQQVSKLKLSTFVNLIDTLQTKFSCCGVESVKDWIERWDHYIAPSCCRDESRSVSNSWALKFGIQDANHEFEHCKEEDVHSTGCLSALREDERGKYNWISDLIIFLIIITLANTILSSLLFGLSKTEKYSSEVEENELGLIGISDKPRPSQPTIMRIRPRASVVHTIGPNQEQISTISQAVKFNLANTRPSISTGKSRFSPAARRGSSFQ